MSVVAKLEEMRAAVPGCTLAALGDLRTRLILRTSTEKTWPQERLDELCGTAARCFGGPIAEAALRHFGDAGTLCEAVVLGRRDIRLFVRGAEDPSDMVCGVCRSAGDVEDLVAKAHEVVAEL